MLLFFALKLSAVWIPNGDFETGTMAGWNTLLGGGGSIFAAQYAGIVTPGYAVHSNNGLDMVHSGGYAARIFSSYSHDHHADYAQISRDVLVPAGYTDLEFWFAAVLNIYHQGGMYSEDAYVLMEVLSGSVTVYNQRFSSSDNASLLVNGVITYKYLPWMQVDIPLAAYVGDTLTVRFTAYNCDESGHSSDGYIDDMDFVVHKTPTVTQTYTSTASWTPTFTVTPTFSVTETMTQIPSLTFTPTNTFTPTTTPVFSLKKEGEFPNPMTDETHFVYWLGRASDVKVSIFTVSGEKMKILYQAGQLGQNVLLWDGTNNKGKRTASGVFIYLLEAVSQDKKGKYYSKIAVVR